ncbi:hypothetical protein BDV25DRAFT_171347 [Aspergillus avenaceus]|uniref:DUF7702 domain-containing protein n=1 Tax=Aspergillus avenaceus TaxID=36643 RepID=A0A5N6TZ34_ASPAV|nr:hypothetical protein BDV25DRAFT_171347 [Aspergillus avenaceus]
MNGIFPAELAVYLILAPITLYVLWTHRWIGWLPWNNLVIFCVLRIVGGALGIKDSTSIAANIISGIGISPLLLAIDGLLHESRYYRNPEHNVLLGRLVIIIISGVMGAGLGLSISASLKIYQGHGQEKDMNHWKTGTALIVVVWVMEVLYALFSLLPTERRKAAPGYRDGTTLLYGALVALVFGGVRVIYNLISVCTQDKRLSSVYGTMAVRVVLVFLPEALAAISMIVAGLWTRKIRENSKPVEAKDTESV